MIAIPSPGPHPLVRERPGERVRAPVHLEAKVSVPASSITIASSGRLIAAPAIPAAGEAPQRAELAGDPRELVGAHRPDHAGLGERPQVERHVGQRPERAELDLAGERERVAERSDRRG